MNETTLEPRPDLLLDHEAIEIARRAAFAVATHRPEDFEGMRKRGYVLPEKNPLF